ncbi:MAG: tRNA uridine-5-carboxymethylaminomethyl(34) synthesis GTPase MnmE [Proteobacteria bacterium]|nr:tRNA uridine-5-carboxymethylaminomethyl(34) synthesis GTPase MnmE [Pseudomonadota bacterium]
MKHLPDNDTIAAISTPIGAGGIGIVRISGPNSSEILNKFFNNGARTVANPRKMVLGWVVDNGGLRVDQALVVFMPAPRTYTGQDVAEIQAHGGPMALQKILETVISAGARPAAPGEFTYRAFLNGKIDLSQAEAVAEVIQAKTAQALAAAQSRLAGRLAEQIDLIRQELIAVLAQVEAAVDFPDEDLEILSEHDLARRLEDRAMSPLKNLLAQARTGLLLQDGAVVVLAGKPNVGKSSLLNALLHEDRAIVTEVPGTTRDLIEEWLDLDGLPVRLVDTAGLRPVTDVVEEQGVSRAVARAARADLVLFLIDGSEPLTDEDHQARGFLSEKPILPVINKIDLSRHPALRPDLLFPPENWLAISALTGQGLDSLCQAVRQSLLQGDSGPDSTAILPNLRQQLDLGAALAATEAAASALKNGRPPELAAVDLREAAYHLDEITGQAASDEVLNQIFSTFCIGK